MVFESQLQPGSASPLCSAPGGVQFGPPSLTWVRCEPLGRILSVRTLKQPFTFCATLKSIQLSRDQARSPQNRSSSAPLALATFVGFEPSAATVQIVVG